MNKHLTYEEFYDTYQNYNLIYQIHTYNGFLPYYFNQVKEIDRLNNIISELEKWLEDNYESTNDIWYVKIINKLKELKDDSNLPTN